MCFFLQTVFGAPLENANKESPADLYAQYINIIGEVSKLNGLENIWLQYEEPLQQQVNEWKNQYNLDASSELQYVNVFDTNFENCEKISSNLTLFNLQMARSNHYPSIDQRIPSRCGKHLFRHHFEN